MLVGNLDNISSETWILLTVTLFLIAIYINKQWQVLKQAGIPHDPPSILRFGNLEDFLKDPDTLFNRDLLRKKKHGQVYGSFMLFHPRISISDPEILKEILIKENSVFTDRKNLFNKINGKTMNCALTEVSGDQWKRIRKTLSPAFSTTKLKDMFGIIEQCVEQMATKLHDVSRNEGGRLAANEIFGNLSIDLTCSVGFGVNMHAQEGGGTKLARMTKQFYDSSPFRRPANLLFMLFPCVIPIAEKVGYSIYSKALMRSYHNLVEEIIKVKQEQNYNKVDILQQMLNNEIDEEAKDGATKGLTRNEIVANSIMILVGYELIANTLVFLSYCLATCKLSQSKLREEIEDCLNQHGGFNYEGINSMRFLDMCLKESQRLYETVSRNSRYADKDITLKGIKIPAGTHIDIPLHAMAHDEELWKEPWKYKPERFEDPEKIDPIIFQPFGTGPRNCIGMRFAIMEVKVAICKLVQKFDIDVCDDTPTPPLKTTYSQGSMQPKHKLFLKVTARNHLTNKTL